MRYRDLTHVTVLRGFPRWEQRPPHMLMLGDEAEVTRFIDQGHLWKVGDTWTFTVHVVAWLRENVPLEDWDIVNARAANSVRIHFMHKADAMRFKLTFA